MVRRGSPRTGAGLTTNGGGAHHERGGAGPHYERGGAAFTTNERVAHMARTRGFRQDGAMLRRTFPNVYEGWLVVGSSAFIVMLIASVFFYGFGTIFNE